VCYKNVRRKKIFFPSSISLDKSPNLGPLPLVRRVAHHFAIALMALSARQPNGRRLNSKLSRFSRNSMFFQSAKKSEKFQIWKFKVCGVVITQEKLLKPTVATSVEIRIEVSLGSPNPNR
jgi:hypothetical protein